MNQPPNFMTKNAPQRIRTTACVTALLILMAGLDLACTPVEEAPHVIVLGVDGLSPAGIQRATTPHFNRLLAEGAFTFKARAVLGTSSSQNWASMIMATPERVFVVDHRSIPGFSGTRFSTRRPRLIGT